ncbi:MAG: hypothetical protein U9Q77_07635, partial [Candidatus Marinimicrobia bacterium]|nr:hypothetical protein [Candidatus Neomarinimicrobiota bacterium]
MKRSGLIVIGFIMLIMVPDLLKSHTVGDVQFPKVSFLDPYWAYEARDLFYYQELQDLGINLLVTKGKDLNLDSIAALPESLWVWNADLDGAVKKYAYGKEFTQKMDRLDDPTEGVGRLLDNYEYYSNPNEPDVHTQGYLVPPSSVGNERIHNVNAYYFLKCKIPAGYDDTTTVIRFELVETNTLREIPQEEDGSENHGILDEVQEVTDHDTPVSYSFEVTVGDLSGLPPDPSEYVTWQSPIVNVSKKFELSLSVYWYGNIEFWLKGIQVRDYYNNRLVHNPSAIAGTLQSILNNRYNLNPALHFGWYIDEPDTTEYEAYHLVDSIGGLLGLPDHMRLNGATGGKGPSRIQKFVDKIEPDQLLYNKYPFKRRSSQHNIWADQLPDTASDTDPSIYNLQNVWDEWYLNSIKPVAEICYSSSPVIPFWMTIQTVGEKVLDAAGDNFIYRFRDPTTAEIACQVNLALAYGAKGIMYYLYPTGNFGSLYLSNGLVNVTGGSPDTIEWTDSNDSLRVTIIPAEYDHTANYVTNYKYDAVQDVNEQLDLIAPVILSSDLIWKNGFTLIEEEDEGPAIDNVVKKLTLSPQFTKAYIEVSNLENLSTGEKYFWLINRRCLSDEQQTIRLELEFDDPSIGHLLTDVFAVQNGLPIEDTYTYFDVGEDQFNVTLDPGEGKLFRIEKSIPGIITNDFTIESMAYFGTDCIIEAGATVTIKPGTRVIVNRSTQIDVEGELIIDGTPDSLIEFGALTDNPSYNFWTGIFVESGGDLLIRDA